MCYELRNNRQPPLNSLVHVYDSMFAVSAYVVATYFRVEKTAFPNSAPRHQECALCVFLNVTITSMTLLRSLALGIGEFLNRKCL